MSAPTWDLRASDCIRGADRLQTLADKIVAHTIMDPPYEAEAHTLQRRTAKGGGANRVVAPDPLDFEPMTEEERIEVSREVVRVTQRWILVFCQVEAAMKWRVALEAAGAVYKRTAIWVKTDGMPQLTGDRPGMGYESIVCCHTPGASKWNGGGQVGVWACSKQPDGRLDAHDHPTMKPDPLMEKLVRLFTDRGDLILDPYAGSGSTGVAAIRLGRRFIGYERKAKYHAVAMKRLTAAREQLELCA